MPTVEDLARMSVGLQARVQAGVIQPSQARQQMSGSFSIPEDGDQLLDPDNLPELRAITLQFRNGEAYRIEAARVEIVNMEMTGPVTEPMYDNDGSIVRIIRHTGRVTITINADTEGFTRIL